LASPYHFTNSFIFPTKILFLPFPFSYSPPLSPLEHQV
jgi:hypothetical protein